MWVKIIGTGQVLDMVDYIARAWVLNGRAVVHVPPPETASIEDVVSSVMQREYGVWTVAVENTARIARRIVGR